MNFNIALISIKLIAILQQAILFIASQNGTTTNLVKQKCLSGIVVPCVIL